MSPGVASARRANWGGSPVAIDLDAACSRHLRYRDVIACGDTYQRMAAAGAVDNVPRQVATVRAIEQLCEGLLDPMIEKFGSMQLTYGFASPMLTGQIKRSIAPRIDQHAGFEVGVGGQPICDRGGLAVNVIVPGVPSERLAHWVATNVRFDRMYVYGPNRPIHVSVGPQNAGAIVRMSPSATGRLVPRKIQAGDLALPA